MDFLKISFIDLIDIILVSILIYQIYKLIKDTVAINIFLALAGIYLIWKLVSVFHFQLLSEILGQFVGLGVLIIAIVFQQELRKSLMLIGKAKIIKNKGLLRFNLDIKNDNILNISAISKACQNMSKKQTGAIIIITQIDDLTPFCETGVAMNSKLSHPVLESIFFKNSPLHDGAIIIRNNVIISARCVLPLSNSSELPDHLGMRHKAAVGITEESDAIAIIVSEETGLISYAKDGQLSKKRTPQQLDQFLNRIFSRTK
tara:strand:+ start:1525 stop:2301 length:777 start_codon:yes stop_codon:yes gene_type:complete